MYLRINNTQTPQNKYSYSYLNKLSKLIEYAWYGEINVTDTIQQNIKDGKINIQVTENNSKPKIKIKYTTSDKVYTILENNYNILNHLKEISNIIPLIFET